MKKAKRKAKPRRKPAKATNASVGTIVKRIARLFQIPRQAVVIMNPTRVRARANASLSAVRKAWG